MTDLSDFERAANDALLIRLISAETDIEAAATDLERTTILREWVYANTNYALQTYQTFNIVKDWHELVHPRDGTVSVGAHIGAHIRNEVGDMCGHIAWVLQRVYELWGYEAGIGDWSVPGLVSHTYTVVKIKSESEWVWQIQDSTYDFAILQNGRPIDIIKVFAELCAGQADALTVKTGSSHRSRKVLLHPEEVDNVSENPDFYVSSTPKHAGDTLLVFESAEKWADISQGNLGRQIGKYIADSFGLPADAIYAMIFFETMPTEEITSLAGEMLRLLFEKTGYKSPT